MKILKIAFRNMYRNRRRTLITVITVFFGVFVIILARGVVNGFQKEMIRTMIDTRTGDIQIHRTGYRESMDILPLDLTIQYDEISRKLDATDGLREMSGRIFFSGHLTTQEESAVLFGKAIDVGKEISICPKLEENVIEGEFLTAEDQNAIVLTVDLKNTMKVEIEDTVLLFAISKEGAINARELVVKGVYQSNLPDANKKLGFVPLRTAQELLYMEELVTEVVLKADREGLVGPVSEELKSRLTGQGMDINGWEELEKNLQKMVKNQGYISSMVSVILFIIVFSTILNTMMMIVLERTNEIGTLMAIGFKKRHILSLFLVEGSFKGLIGGLSGAVVGMLTLLVLKAYGIRFAIPGTAGEAQLIRPEIDFTIIPIALLFSLSAAILASLIPSQRASRMNPVEALRSV